jgi:hypothetical protein
MHFIMYGYTYNDIHPLLILTSSGKLNDLVGFIVALVALKVRGSINHLSRSITNGLNSGIGTPRLTSSTLLWLAKGTATGRVLQRRLPSRTWSQHLLAGSGALRIASE